MNRTNNTSGQAPERNPRERIRGYSKKPQYVTYAEAYLGRSDLGPAWRTVKKAHPSSPNSLEDELRDMILEAMEEDIMLSWRNINSDWRAKAAADLVSKSLGVKVT